MEQEERLKNEQERLKNEQDRLKYEQDRLKNEQVLELLKQERLNKEKELKRIKLERQKLEQEEQLQRMKLERQKEEEQREKIKLERQRKILKERQEKEEQQIKERLVEERREKVQVEECQMEDERATVSSPPTPSTMGDFSRSNSSINLFERTNPAMPHETSVHPYNLPLITSAHHDRDYYDDDLSSDLDSEHIIDQLPTPPSTPNKFSPKRILHKAKSSINDDSVRNLGRRTSLFLEKKLTPSTSDDFSINGLRRQSSKLSGKRKSLTKKLKRVLSFNHK